MNLVMIDGIHLEGGVRHEHITEFHWVNGLRPGDAGMPPHAN